MFITIATTSITTITTSIATTTAPTTPPIMGPAEEFCCSIAINAHVPCLYLHIPGEVVTVDILVVLVSGVCLTTIKIYSVAILVMSLVLAVVLLVNVPANVSMREFDDAGPNEHCTCTCQ